MLQIIVPIKIIVFIGSGRGSKQVKGFMFEKPVDLKVGVNHITLLSSTMGMKVKVRQNSETCLEHEMTCYFPLEADSQVKTIWL